MPKLSQPMMLCVEGRFRLDYAITPPFVDSKEGCVYFQGAAARMISAFDLEAFAVVNAAGDVEDHDIVEEVGASEAKTVVAVGLGEMGSLMTIVRMFHLY